MKDLREPITATCIGCGATWREPCRCEDIATEPKPPEDRI